MIVFSNGSPSFPGLGYCFLSVTASDLHVQPIYSLKNPSAAASDCEAYHHKLDRILELLSCQQQLETDNGLLRDAEYVKSYVGISTETLYRLQRDGYISVAKRDRNKRYYRDIDVERLRNRYRGL